MTDSPQKGRTAPALLYVAFFLSGVSGLIYESIWSRYIKQLLGSAAVAQVLVMSLFMGGMSIGAIWAGRRVSRVRSPIRAYAIIEGAIGLYALAFPALFGWASRFAYDVMFPALGGGPGVEAAKWAIATVLILPPCILLGTTFPLMSVGILRGARRRTGEVLSLLYFTNSLGAALGAVLSGFGLVPRVGLAGALAFAAVLNFLIFVGTWVQAGRRPLAPAITAEAGSTAGQLRLLFLAVAFGTGLSSFMYEIGWIRLLSMVLGSATHSFEVMLSAFVFGLACGGLWVRKRMDRWPRPEVTLALVQLVMGLAAVATLPTYRLAVMAMSWLLDAEAHARTEALWYGFNVLRYTLCLIVMLPATFCAGMTLPLLTHVLLRRGASEAVVGRIYGVNTLGAIAGAVLAGLVLMPLVGLKIVIALGAAVDVALGIWILRTLRQEPGHTPPWAQRVVAGVSLCVVMVAVGVRVDPMVLSASVFLSGREELPETYEIKHHVDGRTATVVLGDNSLGSGLHVLYTNGKPDASVVLDRHPEGWPANWGPRISGDEPNQILLGLLPLTVRPEAKTAALVGFGSGVSINTLLGSPKLERVDSVEIEPEVVEAVRHLQPENQRAFDDPRHHLHIDDAKAYYATAGRTYDIIISEPTNPWVSGVSSLFTVEYFEEAQRYLNPGGVMALWVQGYELSDELVLTVLAALDQTFVDYAVLRIGLSDWILLATTEGEVGLPTAEPLQWEGVQRGLELLGIRDVAQLHGLIAANKRVLHPYLAGRTPNTDAFPVLDTGAERARFMQSESTFLLALPWTPLPVLRTLGGVERRLYPRAGIGDQRDPHVLDRPELAALLMRAFRHEPADPARNQSRALMDQWMAVDAQVSPKPTAAWHGWAGLTWQIYLTCAPHLELGEEDWWARVREQAAVAPMPVRRMVRVLDAAHEGDGARVLATLDEGPLPLPPEFLSAARALALVQISAPPDELRAYSATMNAVPDEGAQGRAYHVIRRWLADPPPSYGASAKN